MARTATPVLGFNGTGGSLWLALSDERTAGAADQRSSDSGEPLNSSRPLALELAPDAMLIDIGLPIVDGLQVAMWIRQEPGLRNALLIALRGTTELIESHRRNRRTAIAFRAAQTSNVPSTYRRHVIGRYAGAVSRQPPGHRDKQRITCSNSCLPRWRHREPRHREAIVF